MQVVSLRAHRHARSRREVYNSCAADHVSLATVFDLALPFPAREPPYCRHQVVPALHQPPSRALYSLSSACVSLRVPSSSLTYLMMILLLLARPCSARALISTSDLRMPLFPPVFPLAPLLI